MPGDPISLYFQTLACRYKVSISNYQSIVEEYRKAFGLDKDLFTQYICFLKNVILNRDLGPSILAFPTHSQVLILRALPWSIGLLSIAALISWCLGIILGTVLGWLRGGKLDSIIFILSLVFSQIPIYYLGLILIFLMAFIFGLLPSGGAYSAAIIPRFSLTFILDVIRHAILPALSIIIVTASSFIISQRQLVISILGEDYLMFAKAKGLRRLRLLYRYVLRNSIIPQVVALGIMLGFTVSGALMVEMVFNYPGMGTLFKLAMESLDYNTLQGIILMTIFVVLTLNFLIDLLLPLFDPRVRYGEK